MTPQLAARQTIEGALYAMGHEVRDILTRATKLLGQDPGIAAVAQHFETADVQLADVDRAVDEAIRLAVRYAAKTVVMDSL